MMKRLLGAAIVAAIMLGLPAVHFALDTSQDVTQMAKKKKTAKKTAKKKKAKKKAKNNGPQDVMLCHIPGNAEVADGMLIGWTMEVPESSVKGHLAHGDCEDYIELEGNACGCEID